MKRAPARAALALVVALLTPLARAQPADTEGFESVRVDPLVVHYRPGQAALAGDLASRGSGQIATACARLGLPSPARIDAWILPTRTESPADHGFPEAPSWAAGFALVDRPEIVLRTVETSGAAGNVALTVMHHELVHAVVASALGPRRHGELPAWFVEGLASHLSYEWRLTQSAHAAGLALASPYVPLRRLEQRFPPDDANAQLAYLESFAFLEWLDERSGDRALKDFFARFRAGDDFDEAFRHAYGEPWSALEDRFARRFVLRYRWVPVLTSSATLWAVVTTLLVVGGVMKRRRQREVLLRWEREEATLAQGPLGDDERPLLDEEPPPAADEERAPPADEEPPAPVGATPPGDSAPGGDERPS